MKKPDFSSNGSPTPSVGLGPLREGDVGAQTTATVDWSSYPVPTFPDAPFLEIELIDRPTEPPIGVGEAATTPVPAAVANAVFDATGVRVRTAPLLTDRLKATLRG